MEGMRFSSRPGGTTPGPVRALRAVVPPLLLAALVIDVGTDPFARSLHVLSPGPVLAALLLGGITTVAQAMRWRTVANGNDAGLGLTPGRAVSECYRSSLLNAVLPGGVMGDAIRAWRQRAPRERGLRTSAKSVIGERIAGTALLLGAVAAVTWGLDRRVSLLFLAGSVVAAAVAMPSLRSLPARGQLAVWGWSLLALVPLVGLFAVASAALDTVPGLGGVVVLALIVLAGMAIPVGVGGFGPREAVAAVAFGSVGLSAQAGVATSAAYGVLAAVSALPGVAVMLVDLRRDRREAAVPATTPVPVAVPAPVVVIPAPVAAPAPVLALAALPALPALPVPALADVVDLRHDLPGDVPDDARELVLAARSA
jgi:uncharacterized membrane protein YbhN (UPF0104 family)